MFTILFVLLLVFIVVFLLFICCRTKKEKYPRNIFMDMKRKGVKKSEEEIEKIMSKSLYDSEKELEDKYDVIIIGSGISASCSAALLSRAGKKVLLLEKHDRLGGYCHTFEQGEFDFCAGLHFMTRFDQPIIKNLVGLCSDNTFEYVALMDAEEKYTFGGETVHVKGGGFEKYKETLYEHFPDDKEGLEKFFEYCEKGKDNLLKLIVTSNVPWWMRIPLKIVGYDSLYHEYGKKTVGDVLDEFGIKDVRCRHLLGFMQILFNTHGDKKEFQNFNMMSMLVMLYNMKYLPVGGGGSLVKSFLTNLKNGAVGICNCDVKKVLVRKNDNSAMGVEFATGQKILCDTVISSAGIYNTMNFFPKSQRKKLVPELLNIHKKHGIYGGFYFFIACGVDGSLAEIGMENLGCHTWTGNAEWNDIKSHFGLKPPEFEGFEEGGLFYISNLDSFDPEHRKKFPNKTKLVIFTIMDEEWVKPFYGTRTKQRGSEYEEMKDGLVGKIMEQAYKIYPEMEERVTLLESGTSLTSYDYDYWPKGSAYGMTGTYRKTVDVVGNHQLINPFQGFYLVGQELLGAGVALTLLSSLFSTGKILGRSMFKDAIAAEKAIGVVDDDDDKKEKKE